MERKARKLVDIRRHARLYQFTDETIAHINYLGTVYGGKEKGIAAALQIVSLMFRGEPQPLEIHGKRRRTSTRKPRKAKTYEGRG